MLRADSPNQEIWDPDLDGSAPKPVPCTSLGTELLTIAERLGLSLFLTAGFGAGLGLYTGNNLATRTLVEGCGYFFLWSLALVSAVSSHPA
jgi:hypothetical protein